MRQHDKKTSNTTSTKQENYSNSNPLFVEVRKREGEEGGGGEKVGLGKRSVTER